MDPLAIFHYHRTTGECLGQGVADPDPLQEGQWLIPAFATAVAPPHAGPNEAAVFDTATDRWSAVADFRGQTYWLADGSEHRISELGVSKPADALDAAPAPPAPTDAELTAKAHASRRASYAAESDPLYMEWQYDGTPEAETAWRAKVAEIKARYPLPTEPVPSP